MSSYAKQLVTSTSQAEMDAITGSGEDWELIPQAIGDWAAGVFPSVRATKIPFDKAMQLLGVMMRAVYIMGYKKGKRDKVMSMEWKVADEPPTD